MPPKQLTFVDTSVLINAVIGLDAARKMRALSVLGDPRLGNRSALEWIIDQYRVSTDKRSGITNDPNRADEPDYIVKLIGKVTTVSVETVKTVQQLPALDIP